MRHKRNKQPRLPFDDLPKAVKRPKTPVRSKVEQMVDSLDWHTFEDNVAEAVRQAIDKYRQLFAEAPEEKVYQISIYTEPQGPDTTISFETLRHAEEHIRISAQYWRDKDDEQWAQRIEGRGYSVSPADFKHAGFHFVAHPELYSARVIVSHSTEKVVE